ncbi:hypothetical protein [Ornithinimicrobium cavernae]|uniref:hypothetical protein n=1 Tax=Ornithinimicrobium cavernae TaxID=2666047 RepID=UPI000D6863E7|nr:hypothetical protein [Ornithinimicrobium cavernae]
MELNAREWATVVWALLFACGIVVYRPTRQSLGALFRALASWKIIASFVLMTLYIGAAIVWAYRLGVWDFNLFTPTLTWYLTSAVVLYLNSTRSMSEKGYFPRIARETIGIPAFITFLMNAWPFHFIVELLLQGLLIVLMPMQFLAHNRKEYRDTPARTLLDALVAVVGIVFMVRAVIWLVSNWGDEVLSQFLAGVATPAVLTFILLPFLYMFALIAAYERAFTTMSFRVQPGASTWRGKVALVLKNRLSVQRVDKRARRVWREIALASTLREAFRAYEAGARADDELEKREREAQERLRRYAGVDGFDDEGRRLDQRQFQATRRALEFLAACQMGHYRNRGGRYPSDILEILGDEPFKGQGLPGTADVVLKVDRRGQRWWAWRRTVSGWYFGIGAAAPPPDQWVYDGASPPAGPPGEFSGWRRTHEYSDEAAVHW